MQLLALAIAIAAYLASQNNYIYPQEYYLLMTQLINPEKLFSVILAEWG